jgi:hypothetical protein
MTCSVCCALLFDVLSESLMFAHRQEKSCAKHPGAEAWGQNEDDPTWTSSWQFKFTGANAVA